MDSRFRGNDKKKKNRKKEKQKNFMLFMYFMVNFRVSVNGYKKNNFMLFMYFKVNFVFHEWLRKRKSAI